MSWFASLMTQGIVVCVVIVVVAMVLGSIFIRDYGEKWRYDDLDSNIDIDEYLAAHGQADEK